ncbi:hypothetical protein KRR40_47155 [Niabella defluvii]|nr:hypothetical protein KRR40_47155 [Niabella sp. I65]
MLYYSLTGTRMPDHLSIKSDEKTTGMRSLGDDYYLSLTGCYYPAGKTPVDSLRYAISIYKKISSIKDFCLLTKPQRPVYVLWATGPILLLPIMTAWYMPLLLLIIASIE